MSLTSQFWTAIEQGANAEFLVTPKQTVRYRDIAAGIKKWIAVFDAENLVQGDRFILRTTQEEIAIAACLAGIVDGIVPVLLEATCPDQRLLSIASIVEPSLVVADDQISGLQAGVTERVLNQPTARRGLGGIFGKNPPRDFGVDEAETKRAPRLPAEDGLAYLLFTSGTTSEPSGVKILRSNLEENLVTLSRLAGCSNDSRIFNDMILAHADGLVQGVYLTAWNGCALLRAGGFEVNAIEDWLGFIRKKRATHFLTVPTVWAMIDRFAAHDDYFDAPECQMLVSVAAKLPQDLWERIEDRFGKPLLSHYGLSETVASALYSGDHPEMGAKYMAGLPIDCEARIANGAIEGEIELRGGNVFPGYWRNDTRTEMSFTKDGWFKTGDLGKYFPDGSYEILGRLKTVIMTGGVLIRPDEIDEALLRHPAVVESATVGIDDDVFGEVGLTGVVLDAPADEVELTQHLREFVEPRKIPKRIVVLNEIPRGISGKANLNALRDALINATGEAASAAQDNDLSGLVLSVAAKVFRVPVDQLSLRTRPDDVEAWDSFTQLNLVLSLEDKIERQIPASRVSALLNLGDFVDAIRDTT